jgi:DNA-binding beta-propeller fold protein YncE
VIIFLGYFCGSRRSMKKPYLPSDNLTIKIIVLLTLVCFSFPLGVGCAPTSSPTSAKPAGDFYWPIAPAIPKIKWVTQWSDRYDFGKPSEVMEFLIGKERVEKLRRPNGITADSAGNIYVADSEIRVIFVFDLEKNLLRFLGMGTVAGPIGLAMNEKRGILYVSDSRLDKVFGFDKNTGDIIMSIGGPGEFKNPSGMAYDAERERLYVADTQNHAVKVFDKDGRSLLTIGQRGTENGEFNFPSFVALDKNGRLFVVDSFNFRVQIFDADGKFQKKFGKLGDSSGFFSRPHGIGVDSDGNIYVVDAAFNNFQIFNEEGKLLLWVGNPGTKPAEFYLPTGLYVDKNDRIYVADTFNRRAQVFQYLKEPK